MRLHMLYHMLYALTSYIRGLFMKRQNISKLIKKVRSDLGLSQEALARGLGVSFATINRWENGKTNPSKLAISQFKHFCKNKLCDHNLELLRRVNEY